MGARSSRKPLVYSLIFGVVLPLILFGLFIINTFYYPFTLATPNFSDVEAVYDKMVVPSSWVKRGEGANKGIAGRQCPAFESDGCFSKVATFSVPVGTSEDEVKIAYQSLGCVSVVSDRTDQKGGGVSYTDFECSTGGLRVSGTLTEREEWKLSINVGTE